MRLDVPGLADNLPPEAPCRSVAPDVVAKPQAKWANRGPSRWPKASPALPDQLAATS